MKRLLCITIASVAFFLSFTQTNWAQERMRIAWAGSTPSNTPIWVKAGLECFELFERLEP